MPSRELGEVVAEVDVNGDNLLLLIVAYRHPHLVRSDDGSVEVHGHSVLQDLQEPPLLAG